MTITLHEIVDCISGDYPLLTKISEDRFICCSRLFNRESNSFEPGYLYIGLASQLPDFRLEYAQPINFMLIEDVPVPADYTERIYNNFVFLEKGNEVVPVFNRVQEIFIDHGFVASAANELVQCIARVNSFQEIVEKASGIFGNPILLLDASLYVLASSKDATRPTDPVWSSFIQKGYASEAAFTDLDRTQDQPHYWMDLDEGPRILHSKIRSTRSDVTIGYVVILEHNRPFTRRDTDLMQTLSNVFSIGLQIKQYSHFIPETVMDAFIKNLLSGEHYDPGAIEWRINRFGWRINEGYIVHVAMDNVFDFKTKSGNYKKIIQDFFPFAYTLIYKGNIVAIVESTAKAPRFSDQKKGEFVELLKKHNLCAGVSNCFHHPCEIAEHYEQTSQALALGLRTGYQGPLFLYSDHMVAHLLSAASIKLDLKNLCEPILYEILECDQVRDTPYAYTLFMYLKNCMDVKRSAEAMHVHYNTLKYRLDRIEDLFGLNVQDSGQIFNLWVSFHILGFLGELRFDG